MKPSEYLLILKKKTAEEVKGLNPKSRKFIKVMSKVDLEYGKELDKKFVNKGKLRNVINELLADKYPNYEDRYNYFRIEILKLLEE